MTINNILEVIDLKNISRFNINGKPKSLLLIKTKYGEYECALKINATHKELTQDAIKVNLDIKSIKEYEAVLDLLLPNTSSYIFIELNFIVKEDI